jgi:hypothetical protein
MRRILFCCFLLALPTLTAAQDAERRLEAGGLVTYVFLEQIGSGDYRAGTGASGLGGRLVYRMLPHLDLDGEVILHPNAGVSGHRVQGFAGVKAGHRFSKLGLFAKARPGFIYFAKDPFGVSRPGGTLLAAKWANSMEAAIDFGGVFEYYSSRGAIIRFDLADVVIRYEPRSVFISQFVAPIKAGDFTTHNRQWSLGFGFRF